MDKDIDLDLDMDSRSQALRRQQLFLVCKRCFWAALWGVLMGISTT